MVVHVDLLRVACPSAKSGGCPLEGWPPKGAQHGRWSSLRRRWPANQKDSVADARSTADSRGVRRRPSRPRGSRCAGARRRVSYGGPIKPPWAPPPATAYEYDTPVRGRWEGGGGWWAPANGEGGRHPPRNVHGRAGGVLLGVPGVLVPLDGAGARPARRGGASTCRRRDGRGATAARRPGASIAWSAWVAN